MLDGEFHVVYMPTVDLRSGQMLGGEALIRWRHNGEESSPDDFMPELEKTPTGGLLTYWVIETIARELGQWLGATPDAVVSLNVPPAILGRGGILYALERANLLPLRRQIMLELVERGIPDALGLEA